MTRPFRLVAAAAPEDDLHAAITQALELLLLPPAQWTTFPAGHVELTGQAAAKLALRIPIIDDEPAREVPT